MEGPSTYLSSPVLLIIPGRHAIVLLHPLHGYRHHTFQWNVIHWWVSAQRQICLGWGFKKAMPGAERTIPMRHPCDYMFEGLLWKRRGSAQGRV